MICHILSSKMCIQVKCAPEFYLEKTLFLFFKNNFTRINHCKFIHHKSHLKPLLSYLPCIVHREYFSIIFNVKKCTIYSIKYGTQELERLPFKSKWTGWDRTEQDDNRDKRDEIVYENVIRMRLCHPPVGSTSPKYNLLGFRPP